MCGVLFVVMTRGKHTVLGSVWATGFKSSILKKAREGFKKKEVEMKKMVTIEKKDQGISRPKPRVIDGVVVTEEEWREHFRHDPHSVK